jgi:hypothetical protein
MAGWVEGWRGGGWRGVAPLHQGVVILMAAAQQGWLDWASSALAAAETAAHGLSSSLIAEIGSQDELSDEEGVYDDRFTESDLVRDQVLRFFEVDFIRDRLPELIDVDEAAHLQDVKKKYYNRIDSLRHCDIRIATAVEDLSRCREERTHIRRRARHLAQQQLSGASKSNALEALQAKLIAAGKRLASAKMELGEARSRRHVERRRLRESAALAAAEIAKVQTRYAVDGLLSRRESNVSRTHQNGEMCGETDYAPVGRASDALGSTTRRRRNRTVGHYSDSQISDILNKRT